MRAASIGSSDPITVGLSRTRYTMKHSHTLPTLFAALAGFAPFASAQASVRITEILLDPIGPNAGNQLVELHNTGNTSADFTGWNLVTPLGTYSLPPVVLPPYAHALLHVAATGISTASDLYLPAMPALGISGSLGLFRSAATSNPADLLDFVSWGGGQGAIAVAMVANRWTASNDTVTPTSVQGHSLAHYDQYAYGSNLGSESWFDDGTPTLGGRNDGGGIFAAYYGCPTLFAPPQIGTGENDNRPWIGETWRLDTSYLPVSPTMLWVAIGLQPFGALPLDPFGIPGCLWSTTPDLVFAAYVSGYAGSVFVQIPSHPALIDFRLELQALVPAPGANTAGLLPTRVVFGYPGSR